MSRYVYINHAKSGELWSISLCPVELAIARWLPRTRQSSWEFDWRQGADKSGCRQAAWIAARALPRSPATVTRHPPRCQQVRPMSSAPPDGPYPTVEAVRAPASLIPLPQCLLWTQRKRASAHSWPRVRRGLTMMRQHRSAPGKEEKKFLCAMPSPWTRPSRPSPSRATKSQVGLAIAALALSRSTNLIYL